MDNGQRQQDMTDRVKIEIKRGATRRRGTRRIQAIVQTIADDSSIDHVTEQDNTIRGRVSPRPAPGQASGILESAESVLPDATAQTHCSPGVGIPTPGSSVSLTTRNFDNLQDSNVPNLSLSQDERELTLVMTYLDHVFPVLFPFYHPSILEGGRSWMLVLIMKNRAIYHTIISLASFFFSVVPMLSGSENRICASMTSEELQKQADLAIKTILRDSRELSNQEEQPLRESADLMGNVVQLLSFEVIIAPTQNWQMHLNVAIVLFEQIFQRYGMEGSAPTLSKVLAQLSDGPFGVVSPDVTVTLCTADQASFRFFSAILLVNDIISSTSLEQAPRLQKYHQYLLTGDFKNGHVPLQLEDFVGHENWVLLLIGEISSLDVWKKEMKKSGALSMMQLVQKASDIDRRLRSGCADLNRPEHTSRMKSKPTIPIAFFLYQPLDTSAALTKIWAYAAHLYLYTVVSGWQPASAEVKDNVAKLIIAFGDLPSPALLRTLVWPFCVAGCLADAHQESAFRDMVTSMGPLQRFGTMRLALRIMEDVWSRRGKIDTDSWDIAACLRCVGHRVLLV